MPCEVFISSDKRYTFLVLRGGICQGKMKIFGQALS